MTAAFSNPSDMLLTAYASGADLVLLFDYDGTLVPIAEHPSLARPPAQVLRVLRRLRQLPRILLGVVSGRQYLELRQLVPIPGMFLAGTAGLELDFRGVSVTHPKAGGALPLLHHVAKLLDSLSREFRGAWLERKRVGLTLHFRSVPEREVGSLRALTVEVLSQYRHRLEVLEGPRALEITPRLGWTKGTAVRMFLDALPLGLRTVLYAGDHANDVDAFRIVDEIPGVTIGIGKHAPPAAKFRMDSPQQLTDWLTALQPALSRLATDCAGAVRCGSP